MFPHFFCFRILFPDLPDNANPVLIYPQDHKPQQATQEQDEEEKW